MKFTLVFCLFLLFITGTVQKAICCENCRTTDILELEDVENVLEMNEIENDCLDKRVCTVCCSTLVPGCSKKVYFEVESSKKTIDYFAYKVACLDKDPKYQFENEKEDQIWKGMTLLMEKYIPNTYNLLKNAKVIDYLSKTQSYIKNNQFENRNITRLLKLYVQHIRTMKKLCKKTDSITRQYEVLREIMFNFKSSPFQTQIELKDEQEKMRIIEENKFKLNSFKSLNKFEGLLQTGILLVLDTLSPEMKDIFKKIQEEMYVKMKSYLKSHFRKPQFCNCNALKEFGRLSMEQFTRTPDLFTQNLIKNFILRDIPVKSLTGSKLQKSLNLEVKGHLEEYLKRLNEAELVMKKECELKCQ